MHKSIEELDPENASRRKLLKAGWILPAVAVIAIPTAASAKSDKPKKPKDKDEDK